MVHLSQYQDFDTTKLLTRLSAGMINNQSTITNGSCLFVDDEKRA
jgi:hypothetical protein